MATKYYDLLPAGMDYPVVFRDIEGFDTLELAEILQPMDCKVYADPNVRIVDKRIGTAATIELGFDQALKRSVDTIDQLPNRMEFPLEGLKIQTSRHGPSVIGLRTDGDTVAKIQQDRLVASGIFGMDIVSEFDMLPVCTVFDDNQLSTAADSLRKYLRCTGSGLSLSPATLKILRSK